MEQVEALQSTQRSGKGGRVRGLGVQWTVRRNARKSWNGNRVGLACCGVEGAADSWFRRQFRMVDLLTRYGFHTRCDPGRLAAGGHPEAESYAWLVNSAALVTTGLKSVCLPLLRKYDREAQVHTAESEKPGGTGVSDCEVSGWGRKRMGRLETV
ncbi:hypothetical protein VTK26DRAFT_6183 [Humicola hyalothermophila]